MISKRTIFTIVSILGVGATAGTVAWGTLKCDKILANKKLKLKDKVKTCWPYFVPAGLAVTGTIGSIAAGSYLNAKELAALSAAGAYAFKQRKFLGEKIREKFPEEYEKFKKQLYSEETHVAKLESIEDTGNGNLLVLEGFSGRWFRSSQEAVNNAEKELNSLFHLNKYVSLNDFYRLLGIVETHFGWQYGWVDNPDYYSTEIEFENTYLWDDERQEDVLVIDLYSYPMESWQEV